MPTRTAEVGVVGAGEERAGTPLVGDEGVLFAGPGVEKGAELLASAGVEHRLVREEEQRELLPPLAGAVRSGQIPSELTPPR